MIIAVAEKEKTMKINQYGDRWNIDLRTHKTTNSDAKCHRCGCEFNFRKDEIIRQVSVLLSMKRGIVHCPCCDEDVEIWKRHWSKYE